MMNKKTSIAIGALLLGATLPFVIAQSANRDLGIIRLRYTAIVVRDYNEALNWYTNVLGLEQIEQGAFGPPAAKSGPVRAQGDQRWIVVAPKGRKDIGIILELAKPFSANDSIRNYERRVGTETRWVFEVEDCRKFYELASKRGIKFVEIPVDQPWGVTEAMFEDLYGNVFVVESSRQSSGRP